MTDEELFEEALSREPDFNKTKALKLRAYMVWSESQPGHIEKVKIGRWNAQNPDWQLSAPSVSRMKKEVEKYGLIGLFGKYGKSRDGIVKPEDFEYFKSAYASGDSEEKSWVRTLGAAFQRDSSVTLKNFPSHSTFIRRLHQRARKEELFYARKGEEAHRNKQGYYTERDYSNLRCGEVYVADHVQLDTFVMLENGKKVRPWSTVVSDMKAGKVLGWCFHAEAPNTDHVFEAFFRAFADHGLPEAILVDNGRDFLSFANGKKTAAKAQVDEFKVRSTMGVLNIRVIFALPRNARAKTIERDFLTHHRYGEVGMAGYTGNSPKNRPDALKKEIKNGQLLSFERAEALRENFYINVANKRPGKGKRLQGMAPDELWDSEVTTLRKVAPSTLKMLCMRTSKPTVIGRRGVRDSRYRVDYWGDFMVGRKGEKVYLRRDPKRFQVAWVEDLQGRYLGEAEALELVAANAKTDVERAALKEDRAREAREKRAMREFAKGIKKVPAEDAIEHLAAGYRLINEDRGYIPGSAPEPVIEIQHTAADEVIRERERQAKEGTFDYTKIAPPPRKPKPRILMWQYEKDELQARNETQNDL